MWNTRRRTRSKLVLLAACRRKIAHSSDRVRRVPVLAVAVAASIALAACAGPARDTSATGTDAASGTAVASAPPGHGGMPGMAHNHDMPTGDGLTASVPSYRFVPTVTVTAGRPGSVRFQILGSDGTPVTTFADDQTKPMHFYIVRSDLTGYQHLHPSMAADGTWSASLGALAPGSYRMYASFIAVTGDKHTALLLGEPFTVAGGTAPVPLPPASGTVQVDGYTLAVAGHNVTGMDGNLTVTITKDGKPVTDLQPYLETYAHVSAVHAGDLAFAHLHPQGEVNGDHGGPTLSFNTSFAKAGDWRLFVQFETGGVLHTAAVTLNVT